MGQNKGVSLIEIIVIFLILFVLFWAGVVKLLSMGCNKVKEKGLKGIAESVWEGNQTKGE